MSSHFSCIGFPIRAMPEYHALMDEAARKGTRLPIPGGGALVRWEAGGGPEIWTLVDGEGAVQDATPYFRTGQTSRVALTAWDEDLEEPLEGWAEGWVEPVEPDEPLSGAFPVRVDLVNFALVRQTLRTGAIVPVDICAIAHEVTVYPDEAAFRTMERAAYRPPVRSFISVGNFAADQSEDVAHESTALVSGMVRDASSLTNPRTGAAYWRLRVETEKVEVVVLSDSETLGADPEPGNVLTASCWMLGYALNRGDEAGARLAG